eukprot:RCo007896
MVHLDLPFSLPWDLPGSQLEKYYMDFFHSVEGYHGIIIIAVTFCAHVLAYQLLNLPYLLVEMTPSLQKYKIQQGRIPDSKMRSRCLKQVLWQQFTGQLPLILWVPFFFEKGEVEYLAPLPSIKTIVLTCIFSIIIEDTWHYWIHRTIHAVAALYQFIHKMHHEHYYPFALTAEYATVTETVTLGLGTMFGPIIFHSHWVTMLVWMSFRVWQSLDAHCGYDMPWSPHNVIPFWGGTKYHDFHHSNVLGNYSSTFIWWDWLCGTDQLYKKSLLKKAGKPAKGGSPKVSPTNSPKVSPTNSPKISPRDKAKAQ